MSKLAAAILLLRGTFGNGMPVPNFYQPAAEAHSLRLALGM